MASPDGQIVDALGEPGAPKPANDEFAQVRARILRDSDGGYRNFLTGLTPRYGRVWIEIVSAYAVLIALIVAAAVAPLTIWGGVIVALVAAAIGYCLAYIQLFIHEAAHFNIARDRALNDRLANAFIAWHLGADIKSYRLTHFAHHRELGRTGDTENSYFNALTPGFLLKTLTGVHAVSVFLGRGRTKSAEKRSLLPLVRGLLIHAVLLAALIWLNAWPAALAWVLGVGVFLPFFMTLRQILEHRAAEADAAINYARTDHGEYTRLFKDSLIAGTLGGAGFSRHLLHHWEPHISYTRLAELEAHLRATPAAVLIEARTTTYGAAFRDLLKAAQRRTVRT